MKASKKLIPALALLLVSAIVLSTASYAWFSMSREVQATSMDVTVTAPSNLLIKAAAAADTTYSSSVTDASTAVELVPASSISGADDTFYAVANGQAINTDGSYVAASTEFEKVTDETTNKGYVDFNFTLKTEGTKKLSVYVSAIDLTNTTGTKTLEPVRFAVINGSTASGVYNAGAGTYKTAGQAIASIAAVTPKIATKGAYTPATTGDTGTVVCTLDPGAGTPTTQNITIRVWFEGEDLKCIAEDAANCAFTLGVTLGAKDAA